MNRLALEKRAQILTLLVEGNSLRATSRIADVTYNAVCKLFVDAGKACAEYQDQALRNLSCKRLDCKIFTCRRMPRSIFRSLIRSDPLKFQKTSLPNNVSSFLISQTARRP